MSTNKKCRLCHFRYIFWWVSVVEDKTEDNLWQKTTFDGRRPLTEDDLWWKMTFDGRRPLTQDDFWRKIIFDARQPLMEDDLLVGRIIYYLKKCLRLLTLTVTAQLTPNRKSYQMSKPEKDFQAMEEMYTVSCIHK